MGEAVHLLGKGVRGNSVYPPLKFTVNVKLLSKNKVLKILREMFLIYPLSDKPICDHLIFDMQRRDILHLYEFVAYIHIQRERLTWSHGFLSQEERLC